MTVTSRESVRLEVYKIGGFEQRERRNGLEGAMGARWYLLYIQTLRSGGV